MTLARKSSSNGTRWRPGLPHATHRFDRKITDDTNDFERLLKGRDLFAQSFNVTPQRAIVLVETTLCGIELLQPFLALLLKVAAHVFKLLGQGLILFRESRLLLAGLL